MKNEDILNDTSVKDNRTNIYPVNNNTDDLGSFFTRFFKIILLHKWIFLTVLLLVFVLVMFYALRQPRIYQANHEVFYNETMREYVNTENTPVVKSDFDKNYWLSAMISNEVLQMTLENSSLDYSLSQLKSMIRVGVIDKRKEDRIPVYMVTISSENRDHLPLLIRAFVKSLNDLLVRNQIANSERLITYLNGQIEQNNLKLNQIDIQINGLRLGGDETQLLDIEKVTSTLDKFRADLLNAQVNLSSIVSARLRTEHELKNLDGTVINESAFSEPLKVQLMNLEVDLARSLTRNKEDHPEVKQLRNNIDQISSMIRDTLQQRLEIRSLVQNPIKSQLLSKLMELKIQEVSEETKVKSLQKIIAELELKSLPTNINEEQQQVLRNREMVSLTIKQLNERLIETQTISYGSLSRFVFIDDPSSIFTSNKSLIFYLILAILLGFIVAAIVVFIYDLLDDRIMLIDDYERFYKHPLLGVVKHYKEIENYNLSNNDQNPYYNTTGDIGSLIVKLRQIQRVKNLKTFVVSSPNRQEGKSLVSLKIAAALAQKKQKVLLVDMDFFSPKLSRKLCVDDQVGLSEFLLGDVKLDDIIKPTGVELLHFVCAGNADGQKELFYTDKNLPAFVNWAKENYDIVIFDTPAANYIPDIVEFFEIIDSIIVIARLRRTTRKMLNHLFRVVSEVDDKYIATILNDFHTGPGNNYSSYEYNYSNYNNVVDEKEMKKIKRPATSIIITIVIIIAIAGSYFMYMWNNSGIFNFKSNDESVRTTDTIAISNDELIEDESVIANDSVSYVNDSLSAAEPVE